MAHHAKESVKLRCFLLVKRIFASQITTRFYPLTRLKFSPRIIPMKKAGLIVTSIIAFVGLIALFVFVVQPGWHVLPRGGKARVFTVTQGTKHRIEFPTRSWADHYRGVFTQRFSRYSLPQLISRPHGWTGAVSNAPSTVIWFQIDARGLVSFDATLSTEDGQKFKTQGANGATTNGYAYSGIQFPIVPADRILHLDVSFDGTPFHFEVPNPAREAGSKGGS
jgi:hypothetical protein